MSNLQNLHVHFNFVRETTKSLTTAAEDEQSPISPLVMHQCSHLGKSTPPWVR